MTVRTKKPQDAPGLLASDWEAIFRSAGIQRDALEAAKSHQAKATFMGTFLSRNLDRGVPVEVKGRPGTATLRAVNAGKRQRRYYFEIVWEDQDSREDSRIRDPGGADGSESSAAPDGHTGPTAEKTGRSRAEARAGRKGRAPIGNEEEWS